MTNLWHDMRLPLALPLFVGALLVGGSRWQAPSGVVLIWVIWFPPLSRCFDPTRGSRLCSLPVVYMPAG